jgi:peptidoglycan/xylan/chitin deacetylase (PgdA/CDA1 family)
LKQTIFSISGALGVDRLFAFVNRSRPVVLVFHGVTAEAPGHLCNHEGLHLHLPIFERLMRFVATRYQAVSLARVVDWLEGRATLPERSVAVTFDDGYRNVLTQAGPVVKRLGIPATLFVATDFVFGGEMLWTDRLLSALYLTREPRLDVDTPNGPFDLPLGSDADKIVADRRLLAICKSLPDDERTALLDRIVERLHVDEGRLPTAWPDHAPIAPDELKQLHTLGIDVGSHTCSHAIVTRMSAEQQSRELAESKRLIEASTGGACEHFSYPNGGPTDFDAQSRQRVIEAGYRSAVTTIKMAVSASQDPFEIPRCTLTHNRITMAEFAAEVSGFPRFLRGVKGRVTA